MRRQVTAVSRLGEDFIRDLPPFGVFMPKF